jgi:hypothetical protein
VKLRIPGPLKAFYLKKNMTGTGFEPASRLAIAI